MATAVETPPKTLNDASLKAELQRLRQPDNWRNLVCLARIYLFFAVTVCLTVAACEAIIGAGWHWLWATPVAALAVVVAGAIQHQLTALGHEASHHVFMKNRLLNELVSDWTCMFPVFSTTHHYRLQHLAHHQFVNDPHRDPNFMQLQVNGHWNHFPMERKEFWREFASQLLPWNLFSYLKTTAAHNAMPTESSPYQRKNGGAARSARLVGVIYLLSMLPLSYAIAKTGNLAVMFAVFGAAWAGVSAFYGLIPITWYQQTRIHSTYNLRVLTLMRMTFVGLLFLSLTWLSIAFGTKVLIYAAVLWFIPMVTSFSFFMMMRQMVQHSNCDRGWLTNTRVFLVGPLIRDSILPLGQDYHLPHHLYATVPHFRLRELHELLMQFPEYRDEALVVQGAVFPKHEDHEMEIPPTILDALGPDYAPAHRHENHVDNTVLELCNVEEKAEILRAGEMSAAGR